MIFQRIGQVSRPLDTGDIVANRVGKTFVFTGTTKQGNLQLVSTCENRYFVTGLPEDYNCYLGASPSEQTRATRDCSGGQHA